jgi:hypothetical protein
MAAFIIELACKQMSTPFSSSSRKLIAFNSLNTPADDEAGNEYIELNHLDKSSFIAKIYSSLVG